MQVIATDMTNEIITIAVTRPFIMAVLKTFALTPTFTIVVTATSTIVTVTVNTVMVCHAGSGVQHTVTTTVQLLVPAIL